MKIRLIYRVDSSPFSLLPSKVSVSRMLSRLASARAPIAFRYRFALKGPHRGQSQHLQVRQMNFAVVGVPGGTPRKDSFRQRLRRYGSRGLSPLFCIVSSKGEDTAPSALMRALPSNSRPLLAERREASGFRPAVFGLVGFVSTGAEWLTAFPDFVPTAFRFSLLMFLRFRGSEYKDHPA